MSGYNQKIVQTNSYVEIWEYEKPIFTKGEALESNEQVNVDKEKTKRKTFDELTTEEQEKRLIRMNKTRQEAKWRILRSVDCNFDDRTSFLTLTTKENIQNRAEFCKYFKSFIKRYNYQVFNSKKSKLHYLAVLERQQRKAWHVHILLFGVPFVPHKVLLKMWGLGAVRINRLDNLDEVSNAGRYVAKYMEKGIGQELLESFGKKAYLCSRNLKKPDETKQFLKEKLEFDSAAVLYETEYVSKIYKDGQLIDNPVRYRKIKFTKGD